MADALGFDEDEINDILADFDEFLEGDYEGKTAAEVFEALAAGFNDAADEDAMTAVSEKLCFNMILFFNSDWASAADAAEADMNSSLIQAMMIFEDNAKLAEYIEEGAYPVVGIRVLECYPDYIQDFSRCAFDDAGNAFDTAYAARLGDIMDAKAAAVYEAEALEAAKAEAIAAIQNAATDDAYVEVIANLKQQRLYLHESFLTKNLQEVVASNPVHESTASSPQPNGGIANVLQNYLITKHEVENNH